MRKTILRRLSVYLLAVLMLGVLAGCGAGRSAYMLSDGWLVRSDAGKVGEDEKWYNGFDAGAADYDESADTVWYCNKFSASLKAGGDDRIILSLTDIGEKVSVWLNGKNVGEHTGAYGSFCIDVTGALKKAGSNFLVLKKTGEGAGAVGHTSIAVRPAVMIDDTYVSADARTGNVTFNITLDNASAGSKQVGVEVSLTCFDTGKVMSRMVSTVSAPAGESVHTVEMPVEDYIGWNTINPYLYCAQVRAQSGGDTDIASRSVGFRDFGVDGDGFFTIDGERFLLKSADIPAGTMQDEVAMRKFVDFVRTCGFNAVRPVRASATQALLNYCDKVGMLVENSADADDPALLADTAADITQGARDHVCFAMLGLYSGGRAADTSAASGALDAVRSRCGEVTVFCGGAADRAGARISVSNAKSADFDTQIGGDGASYMTVCSGMALPDADIAGALDAWYKDCGLDTVYPCAADAYAAAQEQYVAQAEEEICRLRGATVLSGINFAGGIAGYPKSMMDVINDSINDLRFCIEADDCVYAGESFKLNIGLSNYDVLWNRSFSAYIKITGDSGIVYSNTVTVTPEFDENGCGAQLITVLDEEITLDVPAGKYTIAAEFTDLAHPTCGERTLYIINQGELPELTGTVYTFGVSDAVKQLLRDHGATIAEADTDIPADAVIVVSGRVPQTVSSAVKNGAYLIALGASKDSDLPVDGAFVTGVSGAVIAGGADAPFAGEMVFGVFGLEFDGAFVSKEGDTGDTLVSAFGILPDGAIPHGTLIGIYECGGGRVCVCAFDLNSAAGGAAADALLIWAINAAA